MTGPVEHDLRAYEAEQDKAFVRDDYAVANRGRFMTEAIDEEIQEDFARDVCGAGEQIGDFDATSIAPLLAAYISGDKCEFGRLFGMVLGQVIYESAICRAERMAAAEFDEVSR